MIDNDSLYYALCQYSNDYLSQIANILLSTVELQCVPGYYCNYSITYGKHKIALFQSPEMETFSMECIFDTIPYLVYFLLAEIKVFLCGNVLKENPYFGCSSIEEALVKKDLVVL